MVAAYPSLDPQREVQMAQLNADRMLGRSSDPMSAALEKLADQIKTNDAKTHDLFLDLNRNVRDLHRSAIENNNDLVKKVGEQAKKTEEMIGKLFGAGAAVTAEDIDEMSQQLSEVVAAIGQAKVAGPVDEKYQQTVQQFQEAVREFAEVARGAADGAEREAAVKEAAKPPVVEEDPRGRRWGVGETLGRMALAAPVAAGQLTGKAFMGGLRWLFRKQQTSQDDLKEGMAESNRKQTEGITVGIKSAMDGIFRGFIKDTAMGLGFIVGAVYSLKDELWKSLTWLWDNWDVAVDYVKEVLGNVWDWMGGAWDRLKDWFVSTAAPAIGEWFGKLYNWILDIAPAIQQGLKDALAWLWDKMTTLGSLIGQAIADWWEGKDEKAEAQVALAEVTKATAQAGGTVGEAFKLAGATGAEMGQRMKLAQLVEGAEHIDPNSGQAIMAAYQGVIDDGGTPKQGLEAAQEVFTKTFTRPTTGGVDRTKMERESQSRSVGRTVAAAGSAAGVEAAVKEMANVQKKAIEAQRAEKPQPRGMDTTGETDETSMKVYVGGGVAAGIQGG